MECNLPRDYHNKSTISMATDLMREECEKTEAKAAEELVKPKGCTEKFDYWINRTTMKCATCMWFVRKVTNTPIKIGRCRRHAPTMSGYPVVFDTDWCGDHKLNENCT